MKAAKATGILTAWAVLVTFGIVGWRPALLVATAGLIVVLVELAFALRQERRERKVRHAIREQLKAKLAQPPRVRPSPLPVTHRIGPVEYAEADEDDMRRINNYRWN